MNRRECATWALNYARQRTAEIDQREKNDRYSNELYDSYFERCLRERGL